MSKIEWTDRTWNPFTGCSKCSPGCQHCYAEKMATRFAGRAGYPEGNGFKPKFHLGRLGQPASWRKPQKIFTCSMSDLFHEGHYVRNIDKVLDVMREAKRHTFQILTKRPRNADLIINNYQNPLPENAWFGVTAENQECLEDRLKHAYQIETSVRFLSVEPMLGPIELESAIVQSGRDIGNHGIDWVICGGESGNEKSIRPMKIEWVLELRDQCLNLGIPFFFKQWGKYDCLGRPVGKKKAGKVLEGKTWEQFPKQP